MGFNDVGHSVVGDVPVDSEAPVVTSSISRICRLILRRCSHYYRLGHLSRFQRAICPGFGTGIRLPGQKRWRLLSRVVEPGQNVPHANFFCTLRDSNLRPIAWRMRMASLPTHLSSTCDSVKNNFLLNYHVEGPFVRVGNTNPFVPVGATTRDKRPLSPADPASLWTQDKSHLLSRVQR